MLVKNTFGCSAVLGRHKRKSLFIQPFTGSTLDRKKQEKKEPKKEIIKEPIEKKEAEPRVMSSRTKSKIRKKLFALAQLYKRLTFVTLTFVNKVDDRTGVTILRRFLDNMKKRSKDFQYLWVAERQNKNTVFEGNIHFHLITKKHWNIEKTWKYWLELQAKHGVTPRDENYKPSSAFDVKSISTKNPKQVGTYLTKYITKNSEGFDCQVWNCSKKISALYTDFYSDYSFWENIYKVKKDEIKEIALEYCNLHIIPLDKTTIRFYDRLGRKNKTVIQNLN
ncbi:rolling circle replication-associated protein [Solitalea koreensis]|uniref:Replication-associated protein ORF2/G2P domain-containing protein n=1 Tax=Solitalea koreensis TaxID=543615 RepID=A0A521E1L4_9SPHI|nr:hypothetical protein [Solitalea koreensis]SMO77867.1 hypothetical protein SAMN06265350_11040 [Solitalea koreensis]